MSSEQNAAQAVRAGADVIVITNGLKIPGVAVKAYPELPGEPIDVCTYDSGSPEIHRAIGRCTKANPSGWCLPDEARAFFLTPHELLMDRAARGERVPMIDTEVTLWVDDRVDDYRVRARAARGKIERVHSTESVTIRPLESLGGAQPGVPIRCNHGVGVGGHWSYTDEAPADPIRQIIEPRRCPRCKTETRSNGSDLVTLTWSVSNFVDAHESVRNIMNVGCDPTTGATIVCKACQRLVIAFAQGLDIPAEPAVNEPAEVPVPPRRRGRPSNAERFGNPAEQPELATV